MMIIIDRLLNHLKSKPRPVLAYNKVFISSSDAVDFIGPKNIFKFEF